MDRDILGRVVRAAWIRWAKTQPDPKPSWLVPYDELSEPDREADRQIAEAVLDHLNYRRIALAEIKIRGRLNSAEAEEFAALQQGVFDVLEVLHPRPTEAIDAQLARLETIEARLKAGGGPEGERPRETEVYSRPKCVYSYCPYAPLICAEGACLHPVRPDAAPAEGESDA